MSFAQDYLKGFAVVFTLLMAWFVFHFYVNKYLNLDRTTEIITVIIIMLLPFIVGTIIREGYQKRSFGGKNV